MSSSNELKEKPDISVDATANVLQPSGSLIENESKDNVLRFPLPEFEYDSDPSDESDDENAENYVPISKRPEWVDVQPVSQDDGPYQVVAIKYSDKFKETFDYFRAVLASNEISKRSFDLTTECLRLNPSNYSVWYYRRKLIEGLNYDYNEENSYIRHMIFKNPKNYQVWEHYKTVLEKLRGQVDGTKRSEVLDSITNDAKNFIRDCLKNEVKNYHAWQLLQWFVKEWQVWNGELDYCDQLLDDDIRNNSAWNHRFFILMNTTNFSEEVIEKEMQYTMNLIKKAPRNESAWNFLSGLLDRSKKTSHDMVEEFCKELTTEKESKCNYLVAFLIKYYSKKLTESKASEINDESFKNERKYIYETVLELYRVLSEELDTFRYNFWNFEKKLFVETFKQFCV